MSRHLILRTGSALLSRTYYRYVLASIVSLAVDGGLFLFLLRVGSPPVAASASGYAAGMAVHWLISTRLVFDGVADDRAGRARQKLLFLATGLLGLAITMAVVGAGHWAGQDPRLAKLLAIVISFQASYMARRLLVFRT